MHEGGAKHPSYLSHVTSHSSKLGPNPLEKLQASCVRQPSKGVEGSGGTNILRKPCM